MGKLYDRLTPEERFRLVIEAEVRGDEGESRKLVQTAPRYTYTQADPAYTSRVRASHDLTWAVCLDLLPRLGKMQMVGIFSEILPLTYNACENEAISAYLDGHMAGFKRSWIAANKTEDPSGWQEAWEGEDEEDSEVEEALEEVSNHIQRASGRFTGLLKNLERDMATDARALWEAFSNFSRRELGLQPKKLVEFWFAQALPEIEELEHLTEGVELDPEKLKECERLLEDGWSKLVEG